jgi:hypothetical protein
VKENYVLILVPPFCYGYVQFVDIRSENSGIGKVFSDGKAFLSC